MGSFEGTLSQLRVVLVVFWIAVALLTGWGSVSCCTDSALFSLLSLVLYHKVLNWAGGGGNMILCLGQQHQLCVVVF